MDFDVCQRDVGEVYRTARERWQMETFDCRRIFVSSKATEKELIHNTIGIFGDTHSESRGLFASDQCWRKESIYLEKAFVRIVERNLVYWMTRLLNEFEREKESLVKVKKLNSLW